MINIRKFLSFLFLIVSVNAFADTLPDIEQLKNNLFGENDVVQGGCVLVDEGTMYMDAEYEIESYFCKAGQYLPKNSEECVICPKDSYCTGGTYTFNESEDTGISYCKDGFVSPAGTSDVAGCGKILHIGEEDIYITTVKPAVLPALAVKIEGETDLYYAKMTSVSEEEQNNTPTSVRTTVDGTEYYIHNNTIQGEQ